MGEKGSICSARGPFRKRNWTRRALILAGIAALFTILMASVAVGALGWTTTRLTDNVVYEGGAEIDGDYVVWRGDDADDGTVEIFLYDGRTTRQLTDTPEDEGYPDLDKGWVVWAGYDGNGSDSEIFLYHAGRTLQITDNDYADFGPTVSGKDVAWIGDKEIYLYRHGSIQQITDDGLPKWGPPLIDDGQVMWVAWDGSDRDSTEIFFYDGTSVLQLTDNNVPDGIGADQRRANDLGDGQVVWQSGWASQAEILLYDAKAGLTNQVSANDIWDTEPQVSKGVVVWQGTTADSSEIFMYDSKSGVETQLTDDSSGDYSPQIAKGHVAWIHLGGISAAITYSVMSWRGGSTQTVWSADPNNRVVEVRADKHGLVWLSDMGTGTYNDVFMAR